MTIDVSPVDGLVQTIRRSRAHRMPSPEQQRFDTALEELEALARSAPTFDIPFADDVLERLRALSPEGLHLDADQELALLLYRHAQDSIEQLPDAGKPFIVDPVEAAVLRVAAALKVVYGVARVSVSTDGVNPGGAASVPAGVTLVFERTGPDVDDMSFQMISGPWEGEIGPLLEPEEDGRRVSILDDAGVVCGAGVTTGELSPHGDVWVKVKPSFRPGLPHDLCSYPPDRLRYEDD